MRAAEAVVRQIEPAVRADPRSGYVTLAFSAGGPGAGGSLFVAGNVADGRPAALHRTVLGRAGGIAVQRRLFLGDRAAPSALWTAPNSQADPATTSAGPRLKRAG